MSAAIGAAIAMQALGSIMDMISKMTGRETPALPKDKLASLLPAVKTAMTQGLSGAPDYRALTAALDAIKKQYAGATMQMTRGVGPAYEGRIRATMLGNQAKTLAEAQAQAWQQAQNTRNRLAALLANRNERGLGRQAQFAWQAYGTPTSAQRVTGGLGAGLGSGANIAMLYQLLQEAGKSKKVG